MSSLRLLAFLTRRSAVALLALPSLALGLAAAAHSPAPLAAQGTSGGIGVPDAKACRVRVHSTVRPSWARLGDPVTVQTQLRFDCPAGERPYHLMLAVDRAALGDAVGAARFRAELAQLLLRMDLPGHPRARVGLVAFDQAAQTLCAPTGDQAALRACLDRLTLPAEAPTGREGLAAGLAEAHKALIVARSLAPPREDEAPLREGLSLLVTGVAADTACPAALQALRDARAEGIAVEPACLSGSCPDACLQSLTPVGRGNPIPDWSEAAAWMQRQVWSTRATVWQLSLREQIPGALRVDPATFDPAGAHFDPLGRGLRWDFETFDQDELRISHALAAREPGTWPVRESGQLLVQDSLGETTVLNLPRPRFTAFDREPAQVFLPRVSRETGASIQPFGDERAAFAPPAERR